MAIRVLSRITIGIGILLTYMSICPAHTCNNSHFWHDASVIYLLKSCVVVSVESMRDYLLTRNKQVQFENGVYLLTLEHGLKAVFKPSVCMADVYAEIAAYRASRYLGFPYIPPTIFRCINGIPGSLQLFIDTSIDMLDEHEYQTVMQQIDPQEYQNLKIFYFVFGQWDTGPHNLLAYCANKIVHLIAIDNSGIANRQYVQYGKLPFVRIAYSDGLQTDDWNQSFPFHKAAIIEKCSGYKLKTIFKNSFTDEFYESFQSYDTDMRYVIYQNSLYRQFHANDFSFVLSFTDTCSMQTLAILRTLDIDRLKEIFGDATKYVSDVDLRLILDRRDQVLAYFDNSELIT